MKKLKIPTSFTIELEDDQEHEVDIIEYQERMSIVSYNKLQIIDNALNIENELERIISFYFFGRDHKNKEQAKVFETQILFSNWCSFESKRKLVMFILEKQSLFDNNKSKDEFDKSLRKIMKYRNAFTHGKVKYLRERVKLSWYEGVKPIDEFLTDEFLAKIETDFLKCFKLVHDYSVMSGTTIQKTD
ncbi:hypothetical protein [Fulvivirga sp.]|uniref:hypothetical protein n=1 Tax=Fulvivirga sp. TaxID=1931237 RepID=UPI0032EAF88B